MGKNGIVLTLKDLKDLGVIKRKRKKGKRKKTNRLGAIMPKSDLMVGYTQINSNPNYFNPQYSTGVNTQMLIKQGVDDAEKRLQNNFANRLYAYQLDLEGQVNRHITNNAGSFAGTPGSEAFRTEGTRQGNMFATPNPSLATHIAARTPHPGNLTIQDISDIENASVQEPLQLQYEPDEVAQDIIEPDEVAQDIVEPNVTLSDVEPDEPEEEIIEAPIITKLRRLAHVYKYEVTRGNDNQINKTNDDFEKLLEQIPVGKRDALSTKYYTVTDGYRKKTDRVNEKRKFFAETFDKYFK